MNFQLRLNYACIQLRYPTAQTILITHVRAGLLRSHNECLCAHRPASVLKAALFSRAGDLRRGGETKRHFVPPQHSRGIGHRRPAPSFLTAHALGFCAYGHPHSAADGGGRSETPRRAAGEFDLKCEDELLSL